VNALLSAIPTVLESGSRGDTVNRGRINKIFNSRSSTDFAPFDNRGYPVVSAPAGYAEWARDYEATVATGLDRPLLEALTSIDWRRWRLRQNLACGTGRTGSWLRQRGVQLIDGVDITREMLEIARAKGVYRHLGCTDVSRTELPPASYGLCTLVLADEPRPPAKSRLSERQSRVRRRLTMMPVRVPII
jgi:SAM-dependent methyltransferase